MGWRWHLQLPVWVPCNSCVSHVISLLVCLLVCRGTLKKMHSPLHCVPPVSPLHCGASFDSHLWQSGCRPPVLDPVVLCFPTGANWYLAHALIFSHNVGHAFLWVISVLFLWWRLFLGKRRACGVVPPLACAWLLLFQSVPASYCLAAVAAPFF